MLTAQEQDFRLEYAEDVMEEVLSEENMMFLRLEIEQAEDLRRQEIAMLRREEYQGLGGRVNNTRIAINHAGDSYRYSARQVESARALLAKHEPRMREMAELAAVHWGNLSERDKACFGRPRANMIAPDDYPAVESVERGMFWPDPTPTRERQMQKLADAVAWMDAELGAKA
jgi:hypothetical protein